MNEVGKLFESIRIGNIELRNRIIMAAMVSNFSSKEGFVTDRLKHYHANIARGGCALNVTEASYVSLDGKRIMYGLGAYDDQLIPGLRELAEAVHAEGGRIALQIFHGGRECSSEITGLPPIGPSSLPSHFRAITKKIELPREMTLEDIEVMVSKFGDAARRAREAGFDAVEIHAAHGYLITQFLSPFANKRTDSYGGDVRGRSQFLLDIIQDVKKRAGADFPVTVKLNIHDHVEGGITPEDARETAKLAAETGADAIIASVGLHQSRPYMMIPPMSVPALCNVHLAEMIREEVNVPVAAIGRIIEPKGAARIIEEGKADLVVLGRALLSDPEWPNKAREGRFDDIRECIGCNQGCIDKCHKMEPFTCLQNPVIGREREFEIRKAETPKRVVVIGGGPAGLEAARVAAVRGHHVTLYERGDDLGGQLRIAKVPPHRGEVGKTMDYLIRQVKKSGVRLELGREVTPQMLEDLDADVVIVATGAVPLVPHIEGVDLPHVVRATDVLSGLASTGKRVLVVGGGLLGLEIADHLSEQGREVVVLEMLDAVSADLGNANRVYFEDTFAARGVEVLLGATVSRIDEDGVVYLQRGWTRKIMGVDNVVLATGAVADDGLQRGITGRIKAQVFTIGDCVEARNAMEAIYEGARVGREV